MTDVVEYRLAGLNDDDREALESLTKEVEFTEAAIPEDDFGDLPTLVATFAPTVLAIIGAWLVGRSKKNERIEVDFEEVLSDGTRRRRSVRVTRSHSEPKDIAAVLSQLTPK
jgi:hypothetical protein